MQLYDWIVSACPGNESFFCGNAACEKNCGNLNETCTIQNIKCDYKCYCNKGFVRETPYGPCIPILKCPPNKCKTNEVFECRNPTCDDEGCCVEKSRPCKDVPCVDKCYCADGFVRIDGVCAPREKCKEICTDPNSTFNSCGTSCEATCNAGLMMPNTLICIKDCVAGCFCNAGFIKDSSGICIPIEDCLSKNI